MSCFESKLCTCFASWFTAFWYRNIWATPTLSFNFLYFSSRFECFIKGKWKFLSVSKSIQKEIAISTPSIKASYVSVCLHVWQCRFQYYWHTLTSVFTLTESFIWPSIRCSQRLLWKQQLSFLLLEKAGWPAELLFFFQVGHSFVVIVTNATVLFGSVLTLICSLLSFLNSLQQALYDEGTYQCFIIGLRSWDVNMNFALFALSFQVDMCAGFKWFMVHYFLMCMRVDLMMWRACTSVYYVFCSDQIR